MKVISALLMATICLWTITVQAQNTAETVVPQAAPVAAPSPAATASVTPAAEAPAVTAPAIVIPPGNPAPFGDYTQYYTRGQAEAQLNDVRASLSYFLFSPEQPWVEGAKYPLVLVLHSAHGMAEAGRYLIGENTRKAFPAFILAPALPEGKRWRDSGKLKPSHSLAAGIDILNHVISQQPAIDPKRVYVIGCGMGGNGALGAAQYYSDIFAAAVAISAEWNKEEISNMNKVPLAVFHFSEDKIILPYSAMDTVSAVKQAGGTAYFTLHDNVAPDCLSDRVYNELLWKWLFAQTKK